MKNKYAAIFVTCADRAEARKITNRLLDKKLVACGNIISGVESSFWWNGKIGRAKESLLILKTESRKTDEICRAVRSLHSYEVPEIIALPIASGDKPYLDWITNSIK